jgi:hypothetical protein
MVEAVSSEDHIDHIYTVCALTAELYNGNVKAGGMYGNHYASMGRKIIYDFSNISLSSL